jgi:hypothetical protein
MTLLECCQCGFLSLFKPRKSFEKFSNVSQANCQKIIFLSTLGFFFCLYEGLKQFKSALPSALYQANQLLTLIVHSSSGTAFVAALGFALMTLFFAAVIMPLGYQLFKLEHRKHTALRQMALSSIAVLVVLFVCGLGSFWLLTHAHWRSEPGLHEGFWQLFALLLALFMIYCTLFYPLIIMSAATGQSKLKLILPLILLTLGYFILEDLTNQGLYLGLKWVLDLFFVLPQ